MAGREYTLSGAHCKQIFLCRSGKLENSLGLGFVEISIWGDSFMLHQIRKMIGTAVAVKRKMLPRDTIRLSLNRYIKMVLPLAPSEVLILRGNSIEVRKLAKRQGMEETGESKEVDKEIEDFYRAVIVPYVSRFLDSEKPPWKEWVEHLDRNDSLMEEELEDVRRSWVEWKSPKTWIMRMKREKDIAEQFGSVSEAL